MLLIVAHHYVVNSGLYDVIREAPASMTSIVMLLFGAWGKTGINCFVLITGYFMCKSSFSLHKLLKLYLQIAFYAVVIYGIFCITGHETPSIRAFAFKLFPIKSITDGFTSCFIAFYLFIPFLNILLVNLSRKQHRNLAILLLAIYTVLPTLFFRVSFNYVTWFAAIYVIASYIRLYGLGIKFSHATWGLVTISLILLCSISIMGLYGLNKYGYISHWEPYFFISDSNKLLAVAVSVSSFMWFKDWDIPYSRVINTIGASTFGVLLIHANSDVMRQWLWNETVDCVGHFNNSLYETLGYATLSVLIIFIICAGIDSMRQRFIEPRLMNMSIGLRNKQLEKYCNMLNQQDL